MTADMEREGLPGATATPDASDSLTTPAGIDAIATLTRRRVLVAALNVATWALLLVWAGTILASGGLTWLGVALLVSLAFGLLWPVIGFWNALIGLWRLHGARRDGELALAFASLASEGPITVKTAIVMTLRNEDTERALLRLRTLKASVDATGEGCAFGYFVLSDSDRVDVAAQEEAAVAGWKNEDADGARIVYRRRMDNAGFKAGNLRDFASRWGGEFDLMLPLDADSLMTGDAIVRLVRVMQRYPKLGIVQSLVVGTPSASAFTRIFQFGMRLGMRTYTAGQAWWVGDCGPYWGHNAVVRIRPFLDHCALPVLGGSPPWGGPILSHDQVEAALMRRGGFEVRVLPVEIGSFEDNPPDAIEFILRDSRWCQGNMQYVALLGLPGLLPVSRFQLLWAVLMFLGVPAWMAFLALLPASSGIVHAAGFPVTSAVALFLTILVMHLTPKLAGIAEAFLTPGEVRRFGGVARFSVSAAIEVLFSLLLSAITSLRTAIVMAGLVFGKSIGWGGQRRDAGAISWALASQTFAWHFVFGAAILSALAAVSPTLALLSLPFTAGFVLAIPFTMLTANPAFGSTLRRNGIAAIPEDFAPPPEIRAVQAMGRTDGMVSSALQGVFRSLRVYHGPDVPRDAMDALYRRFIEPGDLAFDIGAHVGDRVSSFRRLGARVVAVEPQPLLFDALRHIHGRDPLVEIVDRAVGPRAELLTLHINTLNPTVSTLSTRFIEGAADAPGWEGQNWDAELVVDVVTLDALIARFGVPAFIKIDVEGSEDAVLFGLSHAVKALSFEFTTIARDVAFGCLDRLSRLGDYRYNVALGETQTLMLNDWISAADMADHLARLPDDANSGDVYAVLVS